MTDPQGAGRNWQRVPSPQARSWREAGMYRTPVSTAEIDRVNALLERRIDELLEEARTIYRLSKRRVPV